eukprot:gb/GECG01014120.1/.p1 GENE.gb/GECG01014120.1/~~gb/GECG01014120.1/.p1  ORF type:complete len:473 (+),score=79.38 gb/GECG01014120.1/:1-1419(+)
MAAETQTDREETEKRLRIQQERHEKQWKENAEKKFTALEGFEEDVVNEVKNNMVLVTTPNNRQGLGYFQFETYLISNAHVVPCPFFGENLELKKLEDTTTVSFNYIRGFYRPYEKLETCPDAVVIQCTLTPVEAKPSGLPAIDFSHRDYKTQSLTFFINRYGKVVWLSHRVHQVYRVAPGNTPPEPGDSGAPVIECWVEAVGKGVSWKFNVCGVLYARKTCGTEVEVHTLQPLAELEQLRQALIAEDAAKREGAMGTQEECSGKKTKIYQDALQLFTEFEKGKTPFRIEFPDKSGLERLYYSDIVKLEKSLLVDSVVHADCFRKLKDKMKNLGLGKCRADDIRTDFDNFMDTIAQEREYLNFTGNNCWTSHRNLLRLDAAKNRRDNYNRVVLQDNTGRDKYINGQPASSVFAEVHYKEHITGAELSRLLRESEQESTVKKKEESDGDGGTAGKGQKKRNKKKNKKKNNGGKK